LIEANPNVTVLIAARPEQAQVKAVKASCSLDFPADRLEILLVRGKQPSAQRNAGIKAARGELIYFLDDDSVPVPGNLKRAAAQFRDPQVVMVGGPNLCPTEAPELEQVFALVLSSRLAFGPSRARYTPIGKVRATSEKELILCNLVARREALLALGGFNETLYPNEENALMDQMQQRGWKLIYDPEFTVFRRPRASIRSFARMLMTYGRGRAEQFRVHPTPGSALNFVPPLFCVYLLSLPLLCWFFGWLPAAPLFLYFAAVLAEAAGRALGASFGQAFKAVPFVILTHLLYGLGFWRGLTTRLSPVNGPSARPGQPVAPDKTAVEIERILRD